MTLKKFWEENGYEYKKDKIRIPSKKKWDVLPKDIYNEWVLSVDEGEFMTFVKFEEALGDIIIEDLEATEEGQYLIETFKEPIDLIKFVVTDQGISYDRQGNNVKCSGISLSTTQLEDKVLIFMDDYNHDSKRVPPEGRRRTFGEGEIKRLLRNFFTDLTMVDRNKIGEEFEWFDKTAETYANDVLRYVIESWQIEGDLNFNIAMFKQFFWQVKRFSMGRRVGTPYFFNILGKQGTGKTNLIKKLIGNLQDYTADANFSDILDDRKAKLWAQNLVVVFDEIKLGNVDGKQMGGLISAVKSLLTSTNIQFRELGTHSNVKMDRTFSAIASSNHSIVNVIRDETGMRRFYEFTMSDKIINTEEAGRGRLDFFFETFNCDYFWRGINANLEKGYVFSNNKYGNMLEEIQSNYKHDDYIDMVMSDEEFEFADILKEDQVSEAELEVLMEIVETGNSYGTGFEETNTLEVSKGIKNELVEFSRSLEQYAPSPMTINNKLKVKGYLVLKKRGKTKHFVFKRD